MALLCLFTLLLKLMVQVRVEWPLELVLYRKVQYYMFYFCLNSEKFNIYFFHDIHTKFLMSSSPKDTCSIVNDIFISVIVIKDAEIPKIEFSALSPIFFVTWLITVLCSIWEPDHPFASRSLFFWISKTYTLETDWTKFTELWWHHTKSLHYRREIITLGAHPWR